MVSSAVVPCLSSLPPEIVIQIVKNISYIGHLLDLALCCRALHDLVRPALYTHLALERGDDFYKHLRLLTYRILTDASLASQVRSITLDEEWDINSGEDSEVSISDQDFMPMAENYLKDWEGHDRMRWTEQLEQNNEDAMLALLFHAVPFLEVMHIVLTPYCADTFTKVLQTAVAKDISSDASIQRFQNLHVVINNCDDDKYGTDTDLLCYYLQLPSIREIYVQNVGSYNIEEYADYREIKDSPLTSLECGTCPTVRHLELRDSKLNTMDVKATLAACSNLKTFIYDLGWGNISYCDYSLVALRDALAANEATLENLWIDHWGEESYWVDDIDDLTPMSSLKEFKKLKNLKVGMYVFFGARENLGGEGGHTEQTINVLELPDLASILPESLETLYFAGTQGRLDTLTTALWRLLTAKKNYMPNLKEIAFETACETSRPMPGSSTWKMQNLGTEVGVGVRVIESGWKEGGFGPSDLGRGWDGSVMWAASMDDGGLPGGRFVARAEHT
ncbi:MAG: hypothetical protein Q9186_003351 [Xanthomendoza sp. 1 TL-2023]